MPRLEAQAKLGYYPLPPEVGRLLLGRLKAPDPPVILDPCAGEGAALAQLAAGLGCRPGDVHAVELEDGRGRALANRLPAARVLTPCGFEGTAISPGGFGLVYLNPPFDDTGFGGRAEEEFLWRAGRLLAPGGVLAFVLPQRVFLNSARIREMLDSGYGRSEVYAFPAAHRKFNEVLVLAIRRAVPLPTKEAAGRWTKDFAWYESRMVFPTLGANPADPPFSVPAGRAPMVFAKTAPTDAELAALLATSPAAAAFRPPPPRPRRRPPLPLGRGHVALVLTAGGFNGLVAPAGEDPHVMRGTVRKVRECTGRTEQQQGGTTEVEETFEDRIIRTVRCLIGTGDIITLES
jgi:SAM-dependent methyltransferase